MRDMTAGLISMAMMLPCLHARAFKVWPLRIDNDLSGGFAGEKWGAESGLASTGNTFVVTGTCFSACAFTRTPTHFERMSTQVTIGFMPSRTHVHMTGVRSDTEDYHCSIVSLSSQSI